MEMGLRPSQYLGDSRARGLKALTASTTEECRVRTVTGSYLLIF